MRSRVFRARLACVLAVSMLFGTNTAQLFAAEPETHDVVFEADADAEIEAEADVEEVSEVSGVEEVAPVQETAADDVLIEEVADDTDAAEEVVGTEKIDIEINQGFSLHEKKDQLKDESLTYMNNFVAGKASAIMFSVEAATSDEAANKIKNWTLKEYPSGNENEASTTWSGAKNEFAIKSYYDKESNTVSGNFMAVAHFTPTKGKYVYVLTDENNNEIGRQDNIDYYETRPLNILAVPVTAYYSKSANVEGGGCPADMIEKEVPCGEKWNTTIADVKKYLGDVYPVAQITVDEGHVLNAGTAEYDMCTDDGQKKLWEEACKLQSKNKETGKDKYDIILAFVMYRQDANGCGQGYTYGKPANIITLMDKDMLPTVAHEIAHCYEVGDEYDGGSYNYRVNNVPLGYTSSGRDKVTGEAVNDTTSYTMNNVNAYGNDQDKYYWLSGGQYKNGLGATTVMDGKSDIADNGSGGVVYPSLHPYIMSDQEFVHYAVDENGKAYPTLSYMGSGYSGDKFYYFTTSVIWDHLFNEFLVKTKKEDNNQEQSGEQQESQALGGDEKDSVSDDDLDLYYDEEYREGSARMVEVSGCIEYDSVSENAKVKGCDVEPMFSYEGDLSYIDYFDKEDATPKDDRFVFAAISKDGEVMKSPVDGEESIVEFYGGNFNSAMPAPSKGSNSRDKRYQDFCEFTFDAEYPQGTDMFVIMRKSDYDPEATYTKKNKKVLWYKETPDKEIDGELLDVQAGKDEFSFEWVAAAFDENDQATTKGLYTMIYYAPQGDDGDVYFIEDGDYENDFGAAQAGAASFSFNPSEYTDNITDKAYVWIKVSDGVNGLDLYTDEFTPSSDDQKEGVSAAEAAKATEALIAAVTADKKSNEFKEGKEVNIWGATGDTVSQKVLVKKGKVKSVALNYNKGKADNYATVNAKVKLTGLKGFSASINKVKVSAGASEKVTSKMAATTGKAAAKISKSLSKKDVFQLPLIKGVDSYELLLENKEEKTAVTVKVVNVSFDKKELKDVSIPVGTSVSIDKVSANTIPASAKSCANVKNGFVTVGTLPADSRFMGGYWMVGKDVITKYGTVQKVKSGSAIVDAVVNSDGTITVALDSTNEKTGSIKLTYMLNGMKYKAAIKIAK